MQRTVIPKNRIWEVSVYENQRWWMLSSKNTKTEIVINLQSYLVQLLKIFQDSSPWGKKKIEEQRNGIVALIRGLL